MTKRILSILLAGLFLTGLCGCAREEKARKISLEKKEALQTKMEGSAEKPLRIAVGGMITPREGFAYYRRFLDYIGVKLNRHVDFVDRENYAEINKLIQKGEVDAAFVCGGPYVDGHKDFGMELLAAPQAHGETVYYSYIIAAKDGPIQTFENLRGKTFAFTDPMSNSGKLVPTYLLARMNETPETFFKKFIYTQSHDKAIQAVAQGLVDGAAVDSLIWEYGNRTNPRFTSKTRIIKKSPPYGIPPFVVRPGLDPATIKGLKAVFLNAHKDEQGREILKGMMVDKFVVLDDTAYDSIREMTAWIKAQKTAGITK